MAHHEGADRRRYRSLGGHLLAVDVQQSLFRAAGHFQYTDVLVLKEQGDHTRAKPYVRELRQSLSKQHLVPIVQRTSNPCLQISAQGCNHESALESRAVEARGTVQQPLLNHWYQD